VVQRAAALATSEMPSFPAGITPHSLRRTFASILFAIGEPHPVVMVEMGHTNPGMTLGVYAQAMRRDDGERSALNNLLNDLGPPRPPARRHTVRTGPAA
jgi:integrase